MNEKLLNIVNELKNLTLLETAGLIKEIEQCFGVDATMHQNSDVIVPTVTSSTETIEEKIAFDVILTNVPVEKKIAILKIVRQVTGLGLKESKEVVDNVPKILKEGVAKEEAEAIKKEIEGFGGKITIA